MKIVDNHVHVGWFSDGYHSPQEIAKAEFDSGITEFCVSSTSLCVGLYKLIVKEMLELKDLGGKNVHPILWISPKMLNGRGRWILPYMLKNIEWEGVKMHWRLHHAWCYDRKLLNNAMSLVKDLGVPLLLHTGETKEDHPNNFLSICEKNPDVTIIFAHGRPPLPTIEILKKYDNVLVDTSFMPREWISDYLQNDLEEKLIFGTDLPINRIYYSSETHKQYILRCIGELKEVAGDFCASNIFSKCPYGKI